ncbi:unnamed protein product, partial [Choristocarpus tenellus]
LTETGTSDLDRVQLARRIGSQTGGVYTTFLKEQPYKDGRVSDPDTLVSYLFVRGKAVTEKVPQLMSIVFDVLTDANLDSQQRVVEMLKETKARLQASISGSGHSYANTRVEGRYTLDGYIKELQGGVSYVGTVRDLLLQAENDWPSLKARLECLRTTLLSKNKFLINLTGDQAMPSVSDFLSRLPEETTASVKDTRSLAEQATLLVEKNEGFVVPTQVNYVVKGGQLYQPGEVAPGHTTV